MKDNNSEQSKYTRYHPEISNGVNWYLYFFIFLVTFFKNPALYSSELSSPASQQGGQSGKIVFSELVYNFGTVQMGEQVTKKFEFRNNGLGDLVIQQLRTTCGCTAAVASTGPYPAGATGTIDVNYDTRGKIGFAAKDVEVITNDPSGAKILRLEGIVLAGSHPTKSPADVIFTGNCATCHSLPAQGKKGKALYDAVCYLCHDFPQEHGKPRIASSKEAMSSISKKRLKRLISEGIPKTSMPGFSHPAGGPLSREQIDSLTDYIISIQKK